VIIHLLNTRTVELLEHYARYVARNDDVAATPAALAEGMLLGFLDEHDDFRRFMASQVSSQTPPVAAALPRSPRRVVLNAAGAAYG
jgi:hypothetical protein